MTQKEAIAKAPERRVRRTPVGTRNVLTVTGKDPEYTYRIVNDTGDRINTFTDNGWELVPENKVRIGDKRLGSATSEEGSAKAQVGQGITGYVMRIRNDWYAEDQAAKQANVNASEAAMREKALDGTYGKLELSRS